MTCYPGASTLRQACERYEGPFGGATECPGATGKCQKGYQITCGSSVSGSYIAPVLNIPVPDECRRICDENPQCILFVQTATQCVLYKQVNGIYPGYQAIVHKKICEPVPVVPTSSSETLPSPIPTSESSVIPEPTSSVEASPTSNEYFPSPTSSSTVPSPTVEPMVCYPGGTTLPEVCPKYTGDLAGNCPSNDMKCQGGYQIECGKIPTAFNLLLFSMGSVSGCKAYCGTNPDCIAFGYDNNDGYCYLFSEVTGRSNANADFDTYVKVCDPAVASAEPISSQDTLPSPTPTPTSTSEEIILTSSPEPTSSTALPVPTTIIRHGDFENVEFENSGWSLEAEPEVASVTITDVAHQGMASLRIAPAVSDTIYVITTAMVTGGKTYDVSLWTRQLDNKVCFVEIGEVRNFDGITTTWREITGSYTAPIYEGQPEFQIEFVLAVRCPLAGAAIYFDDIVMIERTTPVTVSTVAVLI